MTQTQSLDIQLQHLLLSLSVELTVPEQLCIQLHLTCYPLQEGAKHGRRGATPFDPCCLCWLDGGGGFQGGRHRATPRSSGR